MIFVLQISADDPDLTIWYADDIANVGGTVWPLKAQIAIITRLCARANMKIIMELSLC